MMTHYYILDGHLPVPVNNVLEWGRWFETADRRVDEAILINQSTGEKIRVSTVFLGLDHSLGVRTLPDIFETMVFGGPMSMEQDRYSTWAEAVRGHEEMVERVRAALEEGGDPNAGS